MSTATSKCSASAKTITLARCFPFQFLQPTRQVARRKFPPALPFRRDGKRIYVALNFSNRLVELDAATGRVLRIWDVGVAPYDVVLAGHKVYVSNWGGRRPDANSMTGAAGRGMRVRVDPRSIASEGSVSVIDLERHESHRNSDWSARLRPGAIARRSGTGRGQRRQRHVKRH